MRRTEGAPMVDGDGMKEREKACESSPPNADVVWNVQSSVMPVMYRLSITGITED